MGATQVYIYPSNTIKMLHQMSLVNITITSLQCFIDLEMHICNTQKRIIVKEESACHASYTKHMYT